jgi:hypothetical protein
MLNFEIFDIDAGCFDLNSLDPISTLTLIDSLSHSTLLEFSQSNKYYRSLCKKRLFKRIPLIPSSRTYEFEAAQTFDIWLGLEDDKFQSERNILINNSKFTSTLIISAFNERFWNSVKHSFQAIKSLILEVKDIEEMSIYEIIKSLPNISYLKLSFFKFKSTKKLGHIPRLPNNIYSLEVSIANNVVCSYEMLQFLNSHSNLKRLKFNSSDLLEGLLSPYPSLIVLYVNITTKSTRLAQAIPNLINLTTIDLTYPCLNKSLVNKVKNLPKLKKIYLQKYSEASIFKTISS